MNQNPLSETQSSISPEQPEPQFSPPAPTSTNWSKVLLLLVLSLLVSTASVYGGLYIGKKQFSNQKPANIQETNNLQEASIPIEQASEYSNNPSKEQNTNDSAGMIQQDPCETGDKNNCIMYEAYSKLFKSSLTNYTIVWSEAFKVCEKYPSDQSILYSVAQCKLDVCLNLAIGDGNIKYDYPEKEKCREEVISMCPNGSIIDNVPCSCERRAGTLAAWDEEWLNNYWNKHRKDDPPIYCCDGIVEDDPC